MLREVALDADFRPVVWRLYTREAQKMRNRLDFITQFAEFAAEQGISVQDPNAQEEFFARTKDSLSEALTNPIWIHGHRTQAMFEAMLVSLGECKLIKQEDNGRAHPVGQFCIPDFRVILKNDKQWLIEVKNAHRNNAENQKKKFMKPAYKEKLESYAAATGGELKLGIFWARWGLWTLINPQKFVDENGSVIISMVEALKEDEMGALGDRTIGTQPPLRLRFIADPEKARDVTSDGTAHFTIGGAKIFCGENEITDPVELQAAYTLIRYGDWEESSNFELDGDKLKFFEFQFEPQERQNEKMGFEFIGRLSQIFARYYAEATVSEGRVTQMHAPSQPDWFAPFVSADYQGEALPLWKFVLSPRPK